MAYLRVLEGGQPGLVVKVREGDSVLGRHTACDMILDSESVSRRHAKISLQNGTCVLEDMDSRNGTVLNGKKVQGVERLDEGDKIKICEFVLSFHRTEPSDPSAPVYIAPQQDEEPWRAVTKKHSNPAPEPLPGKLTLTPDGGAAVLAVLDPASGSSWTRADQNPESKLRALLRLSQKIGTMLELDELLPTIVDSLLEIFPQADAACLLMPDDLAESLVVQAAKYRGRPQLSHEAPSMSVARLAFNSKEALLSGDATHDIRFESSDSVRANGIQSLLCVPLVRPATKPLGVIQVAMRATWLPFKREDLDTLVAVASQVTLAINNAHLHESAVQRVAELVKSKEELERTNEEMQEFAYVTSHDLQEPLRSVIGFCGLLQRHCEGKLDADAVGYIQEAVAGGERMRLLIAELLKYSRVESRGQAFQRSNLNSVMKDVLANLNAAIEDSGAEVTHDPLPTIVADRTQMIQVLQNLIGNAIKFHGDATPKIHVAAFDSERDWTISVSDNGLGIEPKQFDRIFVIFQQLHAREKFEGTGMGLAICKRIIERHGGRIWVDSRPGEGSVFYFTLPKKTPAPPRAEKAAANAAGPPSDS